MSQYYKIPRDKNWNYVPGVKNNFKLSRSKIDLFMECPRCFYIDKTFDARLEFELTLIAHEGDDSWVEQAVVDAHRCLNSDEIPAVGADCDYCRYVGAVMSILSK